MENQIPVAATPVAPPLASVAVTPVAPPPAPVAVTLVAPPPAPVQSLPPSALNGRSQTFSGGMIVMAMQCLVAGVLFVASVITRLVCVFLIRAGNDKVMNLMYGDRSDMEHEEYAEKMMELNQHGADLAMINQIADIAMLVFAIWFTIVTVLMISEMKKSK